MVMLQVHRISVVKGIGGPRHRRRRRVRTLPPPRPLFPRQWTPAEDFEPTHSQARAMDRLMEHLCAGVGCKPPERLSKPKRKLTRQEKILLARMDRDETAKA